MYRTLVLTIAFSISTPLSVALVAEDWSQFRGSAGDGVTTATALPTEWSTGKNLVWKKKLPGVGWSQPVAWNDKIFLTAAIAQEQPQPDPAQMGPGVGGFAGFFKSFEPPDANCRWLVLCLDADTGETLWERTAREGRPTIHIHQNNTYASETPAVDRDRLIVHFGMTGVYAYSHTGELLWSNDLEAYPTQFGWGTGSSPVLHEGLAFIQCDNDEHSSITALDARTGDEVWRANREENSNWSTPYLWKNSQRTELIAAGGTAMRSYDPATGKLLWQLPGGGRTASTPVSDGDRLYLDSYDRLTGGRGLVVAIKPGAEGEIPLEPGAKSTSEFVAWTRPVGGFRISSPALCDGCLLIPEQSGGIVRCLDAASGEEHYRKRIPNAVGFSASPIVAGDRVYLTDQAGRTAILKPGPDLNVVATSDLGEMTWSSPAVIGNRLLIRTVDHLYCIGQ